MSRSSAPPRKNPINNVNPTLFENVGHLLRRAGFGATPAEVLGHAHDGMDILLSQLVDYEQVPDDFTPPPDNAISQDRTGNVQPLTIWWLTRMLTANRQLQEKMTLFWHGHFATAVQKVRYPAFMYGQNRIFRDNALGKFDDLLTAVYKDPAMLIWLDGERNTKQAPNENFGREVMELFVLGHGNYSEDDVHAMARAFTGWQLDRLTGEVRFNPRLHDDGVKTILGQTGNWGSDDAVRIMCAHPATGPFLAIKLWQFFASDQIPNAAVQAMAAAYYSSGHSIREVVRTMLNRPEFYSDAAKVGHIKSPTEFVVAGLRQLGLTSPDLTTVPRVLANLGQELFNPPNVGGWPGGPFWINPTTMLARFNFASQLTGDFHSTSQIDAAGVVSLSGAKRMDQLVSFIAGMMGITPGADTAKALMDYAGTGPVDRPDVEVKVRGLVHLALISPEYQVA